MCSIETSWVLKSFCCLKFKLIYLLNMLHMHKRCFEMHIPRLVKRGFFSGWVEKANQWLWKEYCFKIIDEKGQASKYSVSILPFYSRDLWDSEQLSQIAGSQGSQNSSSDMFSQSRMSQLKGLASSFDVWSQPSNSQQLVEVLFSLFDGVWSWGSDLDFK